MREFGPETYPVGEVGILEDVHKSTENYCYLVITYNGSRYVGVIQCDDQDFFKKLYRRLTHACGHPVRRARHRSKLMDHTTTPQVGFAQLRFVGRTTDCARSGASDERFLEPFTGVQYCLNRARSRSAPDFSSSHKFDSPLILITVGIYVGL